MAARPPLRGFNHNIRYHGRVYHVQTEDSGLANPHIFTHLFHSGVIIASLRADYTELAVQEGHEPAVRKMMQEQHKRLMKQLRRGELDEKIVTLLGLLAETAVDATAAGSAPVEAVGTEAVSADAALPQTVFEAADGAAVAAPQQLMPESLEGEPAAVPTTEPALEGEPTSVPTTEPALEATGPPPPVHPEAFSASSARPLPSSGEDEATVACLVNRPDQPRAVDIVESPIPQAAPAEAVLVDRPLVEGPFVPSGPVPPSQAPPLPDQLRRPEAAPPPAAGVPPLQQIATAARPARPPRQSGVYPLPVAAPAAPAAPQRPQRAKSGVYRIPVGAPVQRRPAHPQPGVPSFVRPMQRPMAQRDVAPSPHLRQAAEHAPPAVGHDRPRRSTGAYGRGSYPVITPSAGVRPPAVVATPPVVIGQRRPGRTGPLPPVWSQEKAPSRPPPLRSPAPPRAVPAATTAAVSARPRPPSRQQPRTAPANLFGSELVSERSLDEVILQYLAEDESTKE